MKRILFLVMLLVLGGVNAEATTFDVSSIYTSSNWIEGLSLYDGTIAWSESDSSLSGIKYWDGSNVVPVPGLAGYNQGLYASLFDGKIAWMASKTSIPNDYDILFWDGTSTSVISGQNNLREEFPSIWDDKIAWHERTSGAQIYLWDGMTKTPITTSGTNELPSLYDGTIAWHKKSGTNSEIYYWNGTTTVQITNSSNEDLEPSLDDGQIAWWQRTSGNTAKILFWDGLNINEITDGTLSDSVPELDNGNIIWARAANVWFWDGLQEYQLTNRVGGDSSFSPEIYENQLAWIYGTSSRESIYFGTFTGDVPPTIPEPTTMLLFGTGLLGAFFRRRRV